MSVDNELRVRMALAFAVSFLIRLGLNSSRDEPFDFSGGLVVGTAACLGVFLVGMWRRAER